MFARTATIVLLVLCGTTAQAGVLAGGALGQASHTSELGADVLNHWFSLQQPEDPDVEYIRGQGDGLAPISSSSISIGFCTANISGAVPITDPVMLCWQMRLSNSNLPPTPVLDGLLKPS